jgi:hypothetical protein
VSPRKPPNSEVGSVSRSGTKTGVSVGDPFFARLLPRSS